ncbi:MULTISPECIES: DUF11 domain-containing protein [unclassified Janthinobacterium]|uniref:DUF11 domain-containing protein n=1 Tax=unclassified Janthinobacterium TaxID=2610881 RepID=UPI00160D22F3|nr:MULTISPECIES: DUF11 domain-containing protein [unclassified Janthinobacterium]MBB5381581.1 putative repeat protein (TIGR01451 family) [Janthinobacterium sp. K2Li3]MBB5387265.1 putative repeat protein (TIGR01451 family) [Janthinobacterium sp. K2E3]
MRTAIAALSLNRRRHAPVLLLAGMLLGAAAPAGAQVLWSDYRGTSRVPANPPTPNYDNSFNAGTSARVASLLALDANPALNAARTGSSPQMNWSNAGTGDGAQLCNTDSQSTLTACRNWIQGRVMYSLVVFPQAGNYQFSVAHDDDVKVDFSTQYSTNYRGAAYNVPVGSVSDYSANETDFQNLSGNFNSATPGGCYLARVLWNNVGGINYMHMRWTRPDGVTEIIPAAQLRDPSLASSYTSCTNSKADLAVNKVGPAQFVVGTPLSYTVKVWNRGPANGTGATFSDVLPASLSNVSWTCAASGGASCGSTSSGSGSNTINFTVGSLPANTATTAPTSGAYLTISITATPGNVASIANTASVVVSPNETDTDLSNNSSTTTATAKTNILTVLKALTPAADPGLFIMNANGTLGTAAGNGATATATVLSGTSVSLAETAGVGTSLAQYQSSYSCARTDTAAVVATGATVSGSLTMPDAPVTCTISNRRLQADMQAVTTIPAGPYNAGQSITVTGVCTNNGPDPAVAPTCVMSGLPAGATATCSAAAVPFTVNSRINCSSTFNLPASGNLSITTTAASATLDPTPANNVDTKSLGVVSPLVSVKKTVDKASAYVGDTLTWTLAASNGGTGATTAAVILTDSLPGNLSSIVVTPTAPTTCSALVGNVLTCSVPAGLAQGAAAQVKVSAVVTLNGSFINSVLPSGGNGAVCLLPGDCQTTTTVQKPLVDVTTTLNGFPSVTNAGDAISGTVTYTNLGPGTAEGVTYTLKLPAGLANVSVTGVSGAYNAVTGFIVLSGLPVNLAAGQSLSFTLRYTQPATNVSMVNSTIATTSVEVANDLPNSAMVTVPGPNIRVSKSVNKTTANVGDDITWTITARNTGGVANQGVVTLADILPANLVVTSVTAQPGVTCPPLASWQTSSTQSCTIPAGQLPAVTGVLSVTITGHSTQGANVANRVLPSGPDSPACSAAADCQTTTTVTSPKVAVSKTVDKNSLNIGGTLSWTLTASNTGNGATKSPIILTDTLPAGLADLVVVPVAPTICAVPVGNVVTCTVPAGLAAGASASVSVTARPTIAGTVANNLVPSGPDSPVCLQASDCQTSSIVTSPKVAVSKTVDKSSVNLGGTLSWTLTVSNTGNGLTTAPVVLVDTLPANLTGLVVTPVAPAVCAVPVGNILTCTVPAGLAGGGATASVTVTAQPAIAGTFANSVVPSGADNPACLQAGDCQTSSTVTSPKVAVSKTVDRTSINIGSSLNWTLTVSNSGNGATTAPVVLSDTLPANLTGLVVTPAAPATCAPVVGNILTCTVPAGLAGGAAASVTVTAQPTIAGTFANSVLPSGPDSPVCLQASDCQTSSTVTSPKVAVTKTVDKSSINLGGSLSWTLTVSNSGSGATTAPVVLVDTLPANLTGLVVTPAAPATCAAVAGNILTCTVPAGLAGGAAASVNVTARPAVAGTFANSVVPSGPDGPLCLAPADCATSSTVTSPSVAVTKTADKSSANLGDTISWTLKAVNSGTGATTGVITLTDTLPVNVSALQILPVAPATCAAVTGNTLTCSVPAGLAGGGGVASIVVKAVANAAGTVANSLLPSGPDNPVCATPADCQTSTNVTSPSVTVKKTADRASVNVGDAITWTLTASNGGTGPTTGIVSLADSLPAGLANIQVTPQAPTTCAAIAGSTLTCSVPAGLAPGASAKVVVKATATLAGAAVNSVLPSGPDNPICAQPADCGTSTTVVKLLVDVTTTLNNFPPNTQPGDLISGVVSYANVGPGAADGVTYSLKLTAGLSGVTVAGASGTYNSGTGVLTLTGLPGSLASGQSTSFTISYTQPANNLSLVTSTIATTSQEVANDLPNTATVSVPGPIIRVTKLADKQVANVGDTVTWTITAVNTGSLANQGVVTLTDILPANVAVTAVTPGAGVSCPPLASWQANSTQACTIAPGQLTPNGSRSITIAARGTLAGSLGNKVLPSGPDNPACAQVSSCQSTTTLLSPQVTVRKSVDKSNINVGDALTWTIAVANNGTGPTAGVVTLTDGLPANLTLSQVLPAAPATCGAPAGSQLVCTVPAGFAAGASLNIVVKGVATAAGAYVNTVLPSGPDNPVCSQVADCSTSSTAVKLLVDVTTTLNGFPGSSNAGDTITGTVSYSNIGPGAAEGLTYSLQLTPGLAGVSVSGVSGSYDAATGLVSFVGLPVTLTAGQGLSFQLRYTQPANNLSTITSRIATSSTEVPNDQPNMATVTTPGSIVRVGKTANKSVANVGEDISWTITASNTGSLANQGVVTLKDILPPNIIVTSVTPDSGVICPPLASWLANSSQSCSIAAGQLAANNGLRKVVLTGHASAGGSLANQVVPSGPDNPACIQASACLSTTNITSPVLALRKTVDKAALNIGDTLAWTVTLANNGTGASTAVATVTDSLPAGLANIVVTPAAPTTCAPVAGNVLSCSVPAGLNAGASASVQISARATVAGSLANSVTVSGPDNPVCLQASDCSTSSTVSSPNLNVAKSVDKQAASVGDTLTWTLSVRNSGSGASTGVVTLTDTLPAGVSNILLAPTAPATCAVPVGNVVTCSVPAGLAAGASASVRLSATATLAGSLNNTLVPAGPDNPVCLQAGDCSTNTVVSALLVDVTTTLNGFPPSSNAGENISGVVTFSNEGAGVAQNVTYSLQLEKGLAGVALSAISGAPGVSGVYNSSTGMYVLSGLPSTLVSGQSTSFRLFYVQPASNNSRITSVISTTSPAVPVGLPKTATTSLPGPLVRVTKTVDKATAAVGDTLSWTITASNTGNLANQGVVTLGDVLPANITVLSVTPDAGVICPALANWTAGSVQSCSVAVGQLAAVNGSRSVRITGRGTAAGALSNRVMPGGTDNPACEQASVCQATTTLSAPNVAVRKSVDKTSLNVGDTVTWTITASNNGTAPTRASIGLTDNLPAGVSNVQVLSTQLASCLPVAGSILSCSVTPGLAPGAVAQVVVSATATAAGTLQNSVLPSGTDNAVCLQAGDCQTTSTVARLLVDVTTSLNGFPGSTTAGVQISGTVSFSNVGPGTADNVTYSLTLAPGLVGVTLSGAAGSYNPASGMLTVTGLPASLAASETHSFTLAYIQPASNISTIVSNIATSSTEVQNDLPNTAIVTMPGAVIRVTKTASVATGKLGDSIVWTITAVNSGGAANQGVVTLADILPANLTVSNVVADAGVTCPPLSSWLASSVQTCSIAAGQLAAVNGTRSIRITASGSAEGSLSNRVVPGGPDHAACAQASDCQSNVVLTGPKVAIKKVASQTAANLGDTLSWTITATNTGSGATRAAIALVDTLPANLASITVNATGATCSSVTGNVLNCSVAAGLNGNGGLASIVVTAKVTQAGVAVNGVVPSGPDAPQCLQPADCQTSTTVSSPSVLVKKVADKATATVGDTVSWTMTAANNGSGATTSPITLSDDLPANLGNITVTPVAPATCAALVGNKLVCTVPAGLAPNAVAAVTVSAIVSSGGSLNNTVVPSGPDAPRCAQASDCTAVTDVAVPAIGASLAVGKVTQLSAQVYNVPYTVVVKNVGKGTTANVQALDSLPATFPEPATCSIVTPPAAPAIAGSKQLPVNPAFNGACNGSDLRLLTGDAALAEGELTVITFTVQVTVQGTPLPQYNNSVFASSVSGATANAGGSISLARTFAARAVAANAPNPVYTPPPGNAVFDASNNAGAYVGTVATAAEVAAMVAKVDPNSNGNASETVGGVPFTGEDTPTPVALQAQVVDVIKSVSSQQQTDASKFEIAYVVQAANRYPAGAPASTMVQVTENLKAAFPAAASVALKPGSLLVTPQPAGATACIANPDFNGVTVFGLLSGKGDLLPQESCSIAFTVVVDFGSVAAIPAVPQLNQVYASTSQSTGTGGFNIGHSYIAGAGGAATPVAPTGALAQGSSANSAVLPATPGATPSSFTPVVFNTQDKPMLLVSKIANKTTAELGDSLQYTIEVKNTGVATAFGVSVLDKLPAGFRYIDGTTTRNNVVQADPGGKPGPQLSFTLESLAPNASITFRYRLRVGVGALQGDGINRAQATSTNGPPSNEARARVKVTGGVFTTDACIAGKVFVDCNHNHVQDAEELGIPGVRLYMEDGTNFTTDVEGKYSYCGITPNSHVIKVDGSTLPRGSRMMEASNRNLGDAHSLFLDTKNGELMRADFIEGSCSAPVLEQVKLRRAQGETRGVEKEKRGGPGQSFSSQPLPAAVPATSPAAGGHHVQ